jgi:hypothetical protein
VDFLHNIVINTNEKYRNSTFWEQTNVVKPYSAGPGNQRLRVALSVRSKRAGIGLG